MTTNIARFPHHARFVEALLNGADKVKSTFVIELGEFPIESRAGSVTMKMQYAKVALPEDAVMTDKQAIDWIAKQGILSVNIPAKIQTGFQRLKPTMQGARLAVFASARNQLDMPTGMEKAAIDEHLTALQLDASGERATVVITTPETTPETSATPEETTRTENVKPTGKPTGKPQAVSAK